MSKPLTAPFQPDIIKRSDLVGNRCVSNTVFHIRDECLLTSKACVHISQVTNQTLGTGFANIVSQERGDHPLPSNACVRMTQADDDGAATLVCAPLAVASPSALARKSAPDHPFSRFG